MDDQVRRSAEQLLMTGFRKLSERERGVITGVAKRTQISRDVNRVFAERQTLGDRLAAGLDYEVNLKAEIEILALHEKVDQILSRHLDELLRTQREQLQLLTRLVPANGDTQ